MIFLTSYIWDLDIYHPCGDDVREPTLHLCGEYQASIMGNTRTFMYPRVRDIFLCYNIYVSLLDDRFTREEESPGSIGYDSR